MPFAFALVLAFHGSAEAVYYETSSDSTPTRIVELRRSARYVEALEAARVHLSDLERSGTTKPYRLEDAQRLVATLQRVTTLDEASQRELAEADRKAAGLADWDGSCDCRHMVEVGERILSIRRKHLGEAHEEVASTLHDLVRWVHGTGHYARSDSINREALAMRQAVLGPHHPKVAESMAGVMLNRATRMASAEAESLWRIIAGIRERAFGPGDGPEHAKTLILAEYMEWARSDYRRAKERISDAIAMLRRLPDANPMQLAVAISELGGVLLFQGDLAGAELRIREALTMKRRLLGPLHCRLTEDIYNLAYILRDQGELEEAATVASDMLKIWRPVGDDHPSLANSLLMLGRIHLDRGDYRTAARLLDESTRMMQRRLGGREPSLLWKRAYLALARIHLGQYEEADTLLLQSIAMARELESEGRDMDPVLITLLTYRSILEDRRGRYREAENLQQQALERQLEKVDLAHRQVVMQYEAIARHRIGDGDLKGAEMFFTRATQSFEGARLKAGAGIKAATFKKTPYESRALARLELGLPLDAWQDLERARGRLLAESLIGDSIPFDLPRIQRALPPRKAIIGWLDHELRFDRPRSWAYVIRSSGPVQWVPLRIRDKSHADVAERLRQARDRLIGTVEVGALGQPRTPFARQTARNLWDERMAPLAPHLNDIDEIVVISSSEMAGIPIEILIDASGAFMGMRFNISYSPSASIHTWLIERSSARPRTGLQALLLGDPPFTEAHRASMESGRDVFPHSMPTKPVDHGVMRGAIRGDRTSIGALPRLRWSRTEVEGASHFLPRPTVLTGIEASEVRLSELATRRELERYWVIHFATHALVDNVRPERSALVFSQVDSRNNTHSLPGDGVVTAAEIESQWRLDAELVTLSACETALGRNIMGEGTVGFSYPFFKAGARSLLVSLWKVDDQATALFMNRFYQSWARAADRHETGSAGKVEALREAREWLRHYTDDRGARPFAHPRYWAAFVLIG